MRLLPREYWAAGVVAALSDTAPAALPAQGASPYVVTAAAPAGFDAIFAQIPGV